MSLHTIISIDTCFFFRSRSWSSLTNDDVPPHTLEMLFGSLWNKRQSKELLICLLAINLTISTAMNSVVIVIRGSSLRFLAGTEPSSPGCVCTQLHIVQTASGLISARTLFIPRPCRLLLNANVVTVGGQTDRPQQLSDKELQSDTRGHVGTVKLNFTRSFQLGS